MVKYSIIIMDEIDKVEHLPRNWKKMDQHQYMIDKINEIADVLNIFIEQYNAYSAKDKETTSTSST